MEHNENDELRGMGLDRKLISITQISKDWGISVARLETGYINQPDFPKPVRLSSMAREPRRYLLAEILAFMKSRLDARDTAQA